MRTALLGSTVAVVLLAAVPLRAHAAEPTPGRGPAFGQHIASMALEHPPKLGREFGQCVSTMARGLPCEHTH